MQGYTYSEARRWFARALDEARESGEVRIKRRDGTEFALRPVSGNSSPLDVPGVDAGIRRDDIIGAIREGRERDPDRGSA